MVLKYMGVQKFRDHTIMPHFRYRALYRRPGPWQVPQATRFYDTSAEARRAYLEIKRMEGPLDEHYYWVRRGGRWVIAEWYDGKWYTTGSEVGKDPENLDTSDYEGPIIRGGEGDG